MTEVKKQYYSGIEREIMGSNFKFKVNMIKDEQCIYCKKRGNIKHCRLDIKDERCKNYEKKMDKRKC